MKYLLTVANELLEYYRGIIEEAKSVRRNQEQ